MACRNQTASPLANRKLQRFSYGLNIKPKFIKSCLVLMVHLVNDVGFSEWAVLKTITSVLSDVAESLTHGMIEDSRLTVEVEACAGGLGISGSWRKKGGGQGRI